VILVVFTALGFVVALATLIVEMTRSDGGDPPFADRLSLVPQVKRSGVHTWGTLVEMPSEGGEVILGVRVENVGTTTLTGVVAEAVLPTVLQVGQEGCRYGVDRPPLATCAGSLMGAEGVRLPDLQPGDWEEVSFAATLEADVPGDRYVAELKVLSDQTGLIVGTVTVDVPATRAEQAVRALFAHTSEGELEFWGGSPELAPRSKRLLIAQWPVFTQEHAHSFSAVHGGHPADLSQLFYEHTLEGRVVTVTGRISTRLWNLSSHDDTVKQSYELSAGVSGPVLRCYTPRPAGHLLHPGEEVEVKAVPIAWSPPGGERRPTTLAVCPAARQIVGPRRREGP